MTTLHRRQRAEPEHVLARRRANGGGQDPLRARTFGRFLAAGYDALKAVSPEITVLGVGVSPRGDRAPGAAGKSSPVHFLAALGAWYRASGRPTPLMDGFSFHPYPNPSDFTVPFTFTYGWPNAGVLELGADQAGALGRVRTERRSRRRWTG